MPSEVHPAPFRAHADDALPLAHRAWRLLPREPRRAALARVSGWLAPKPSRTAPPSAPGLAVAGELHRPSGLGEGARLMLAALDQLGVPHHALPLNSPASSPPPSAMPLIVHANAPQMALALLGLPRHLITGRRVIGYWAWDLPIVPPAWRAGLPFVHEVWVPSRFTEAALAPLLAGITLRRVPHAVAAAPPCPAPLTRPDFGLPRNAIVVLVNASLASSFTRKNPLGAVAAFLAAFADRADRQLVLKLTDAHHFPADFAALRQAIAGHANIRLNTAAMPAPDLHALTACADIVLSLHRAEGFGLVPAQAMLLGVPVIATGWSGNMDYMTAASAALVGYTLIPARDPRGVFECPGAVWAEPDHAHAVDHLRRLADNLDQRRALGRAGQAQARAVLGAAELSAALQALTPQSLAAA